MLEISDLPDEIIIKILSYLNAFELLVCDDVSVRFKILTKKVKLHFYFIPSNTFMECQDENENPYFSASETELIQYKQGKKYKTHSTVIRNYRNYNVYKNEIFASCFDASQVYECLYCDLDDYKQISIIEDAGYDINIDEDLILFKATDECSVIRFYDLITKQQKRFENYDTYCVYINKNFRLKFFDIFFELINLQTKETIILPYKDNINALKYNYKILNKKYLVVVNNFTLFLINLITLEFTQIKIKAVLKKSQIFMIEQYLILNINNDMSIYYIFKDQYKLIEEYCNYNVRAIETNKYVYLSKY